MTRPRPQCGTRALPLPGRPQRLNQPETGLVLAALAALLSGLGLPPAAQAATVMAKVVDAAGNPVPDVVVVALSPGHAQPAGAKPTLEIVQEDLRFVPAVSVATPGTLVRFSNKDRFDHHVRGTQAQNFEFRIAGYDPAKPGASKPGEVVLQGGTGPVQLGCFVHSRMNGSLYITESPFHGVTGADGSVLLNNVPEGPVKYQVWHAQQLLEQPSLPANVAAGSQSVSLSLNFTPRRRR
jgi:plastocyanin